jgi:hypothetical protein
VVITSACAPMRNCTNIDLTSYAADHLVALLEGKCQG